MTDETRILIVEDLPADAELAQREIRKSLKSSVFERVETREAFLEALETFQPDVILSDYRLPRFDGMTALKLARERVPLTPLILWTGSLSEDVAVECMRAGANNYVIKENIKRLGPAVIHALEEREGWLERKRAEEALRLAEEKYRSIFENAVVGIYQTTLEGGWLTANPTLARTLGFGSPEELIESMADLDRKFYVDPGRRPEFIRLMEGQGIVTDFESQVYSKDGSVIWVSENARAVRDASGRIVRFEGTTIDITDRKRAEEAVENSEKRLRALIENGRDNISLLDADGILLWENPSTTNTLGYAPDQFVGRGLFELMHPDDLAWTRDLFRQVAQTPGRSQEGIFRLRHSSGSWRWIEATATNLLNEPSVGAVVVNYRDITDRKLAEERIQRQIEYLTSLRDIDQAIVSTFDMRISLNLLVSQAINLLGVDAVRVLLVNAAMNTLEYVAGIGFRTNALKTARIKLSESHAGKVVFERHLVQIPNLTGQTDNLLFARFLKEENLVSYCGAPLIVKGKVIGVLETFHRSIVERDQEWLDFFSALAGQAAIAIDNAELFNNLQTSNIELRSAYDATIEGWSRALDLRDRETEGHTQRVTEMTVKMAVSMGMSEAEIVHVRRGALLHDIGKMGVPDHILFKSESLTEVEWTKMRQHPQFAYDMLLPIEFLRPALDIPYYHHEKWDGTGYPQGLESEQIPLVARIFAIVDVWDALTSDRPYRKAWSRKKTIQHIEEQSGKHFDPHVVKVFLRLVGNE